ncbi:hypothetical protein Droror1_Dr00002216 [Drosera rotundifolia]
MVARQRAVVCGGSDGGGGYGWRRICPHPSHPSLLRHGLCRLRFRCRHYDDAAAGTSTSSSSPDQPESLEQQGVEVAAAAQPNNNNSNSHRRSRRHQLTDVSTRFNNPKLSSGDIRDDVWLCLVVLEWEYYLNTRSYVDISYDVKSPSYALMSLVIAQGEENLIEWVDEPSYPNSTLSWNIIYGSGKIEQEIMSSGTYYIAIGNLNSEVVENVKAVFDQAIKVVLQPPKQKKKKSKAQKACSILYFAEGI